MARQHELHPAFSKASFQQAYKNFAVEEFKRFFSLGRTILESVLPEEERVGERLFSHILLRLIFENFFWLIYIFDGPDEALWLKRFNEYLDGFKGQYYKLYDEAALPHKSDLEAPDPTWRKLRARDVKSALTAVKNIYGVPLDFLYFTYRITSFDKHGKTMKTLYNSAFNKDGNFPVMKVTEAVNLVANSYIAIWQQINR